MRKTVCLASAAVFLLANSAFAERTDDQEALIGRYLFTEGDYAAALAILQPLADAGEPRAQTVLGRMHESGLGVPQDSAKAVEYYQKAADQGFANAIHNLAVSYEGGELGLPEDPVKARELYAKAAESDFPNSLMALGVMAREGDGGPVDMPLAVAALSRAEALGEPMAAAELAFMLATGTGVKIDLPRARDLYLIAATNGIDWAERDYGEMLELGEGGAIDLAAAEEWYVKAAQHGNAMAGFDMAEMIWDNPAVLGSRKVDALAWCYWAEAMPPMGDGTDYDGRCATPAADLTAEEAAQAKAMAEEF